MFLRCFALPCLEFQAYFFSESRFHKRDFDSRPPATIGPPPSMAPGEVPGMGGGMGMPQDFSMPMQMPEQGKSELEVKKVEQGCGAFSA